MRRLIKKKGTESAKLSENNSDMFDISRYVLDFNRYSYHLQEDYEKLPDFIRNILDPYVRKIDRAHTSDSADADTGTKPISTESQ